MNRERPRSETGAQLVLKEPCHTRFHLVLNGDVRSPSPAILRSEETMQGLGQIGSNILELLACYPECRARSEVEQGCDLCPGLGDFRIVHQPRGELILNRCGKLAKQGEMGGNPVTFGRIVQTPE